MGNPLRLLLVEDSENDALLLVRFLEKHGYDLTYQRVDTAAAMTSALASQPWDIVISDYVMPLFSGLETLRILQETRPDLPCIILSGKIGEDTAVAAMKAGACDYIMKTNLKRLAPAIDRELQEALVRQERNRQAEALRQSQEQLRLAREMDQLKDEFIGLVSHELRTPLTVILGALSTVNTDWDKLSQPTIRQLVKDAQWEAESLSNILANLLELARAQAGRLELLEEPVAIEKIVEDVIRRIRKQSNTCHFSVEISGQVPVVAADRLRLERILYNLMDNAVKFSEPGGEIRISIHQDGDYVVVGVADRGIGISEADQERLFKPFQQLNTSNSRIRGTGLGLVVCQRLVEAHRGRIWVESSPGRGSTFYFTVPALDIQPE